MKRLVFRLLAAALLIAALLMTVTWRLRQTDLTPWEEMDKAQLSWVAEGIRERISELEDDLARVLELQREK